MAQTRIFVPVGVLVLGAVIFALALGSSAPAARSIWKPYSVPEYGLTGSIPPGWHLASRALVPKMLNPREVLSLGTGPLPVGGGGNCGAYPIKAIEAMGPKDAIISIQERRGALGDYPPRPKHFGLRSLRPTSGARRIAHVMGYVTTNVFFRDSGRAFTAMIATRRPASSPLRRRLGRILDRLEISPD